MGESVEVPRPVVALNAICMACVIGSLALVKLGTWSLVELIAYRHFSPEVFLNLVPFALALVALGASVAGLRRRRRKLGWLLLAMATLSLAATVAVMGGALYISSPLRTGSAGLVGADEGSKFPIDSTLHATVPSGWVAEVDTSDGGAEFLLMTPLDGALSGMASLGDRVITFSRLPSGTKPDRLLELMSERSQLITMTVEQTMVSGVVVRDVPRPNLENNGTVDSLEIVIHDDPAVLVSVDLFRTDVTAEARGDDAAYLRWFVDFIRLES